MFQSTKIIELGSCAFRQPNAESHCKFIHGYRLTAKFWFEADRLDTNNWVVDFGSLKGLKKLMQDQFDHTTCIAQTDPKLDMFKKLRDAGVCDLRIMDGVGIEKFAEYCHTVAQAYVDELTDGRCRCVQVEMFEHENNSAIYKKNRSSDSTYLNDRADELYGDDNQTEMNFDKPPVVTPEPSPTGTPEERRQPLSSNESKQTNSWLNPDSTWGI